MVAFWSLALSWHLWISVHNHLTVKMGLLKTPNSNFMQTPSGVFHTPLNYAVKVKRVSRVILNEGRGRYLYDVRHRGGGKGVGKNVTVVLVGCVNGMVTRWEGIKSEKFARRHLWMVSQKVVFSSGSCNSRRDWRNNYWSFSRSTCPWWSLLRRISSPPRFHLPDLSSTTWTLRT